MTHSRSASAAEFAARFGCDLTEHPGSEHWFHTPEQLEYFRNWMEAKL